LNEAFFPFTRRLVIPRCLKSRSNRERFSVAVARIFVRALMKFDFGL
jgi:hypothetical protein